MSDILVIEPSHKLQFINLREVWGYRELLWAFVQRDIKVRYRQTVIGGLWAIIQPFSTMVVFSFFFGYIAHISSDGLPYPVFSYAGLVLWSYFTGALTAASASMVGSAGLITKVYFPRIIVPIAATLAGLLDYLVALSIMLGIMLYFHVFPTLLVLLLPTVVLMAWLLASGIGFWLSAINVKYRDVGYVVPFFIQMLLFVTPIIYPVSIAPNFKWLLLLNPMTGIIETHRALLLGLSVPWGELLASFILVSFIWVSGAIYFKSVEKYFADII
jgi:lipopolysaccharide transport system permease protein